MSVKYPFGAVATTALSASGSQAITIEDDFTIIDGVTSEATADRTLNLTIGDDLNAGAKLFIKTKTTGTENTILGTNITGTSYAGVAGKTITRTATYDGVDFKIENEQID